MKFRVFRRMRDYRDDSGRSVCEVNIIGCVWNLRLMVSRRPGFSLWRHYAQVARANYPTA